MIQMNQLHMLGSNMSCSLVNGPVQPTCVLRHRDSRDAFWQLSLLSWERTVARWTAAIEDITPFLLYRFVNLIISEQCEQFQVCKQLSRTDESLQGWMDLGHDQ